MKNKKYTDPQESEQKPQQALVGNAADRKQVKAAGQKEKNNRLTELNDVCFILNSLEGRRLFWRYLSEFGVYKLSFGRDNDWTNFNEGKRSAGNALLTDIMEANPDAYLQMIKENKEIK